VDRSFADQVAAQIEAAVALARRIPPPFDQAIQGADTSPGRVAVKRCIGAFQTQSELFARAARVLAINLKLERQPLTTSR
jgi:putative iron-regulated protein